MADIEIKPPLKDWTRPINRVMVARYAADYVAIKKHGGWAGFQDAWDDEIPAPRTTIVFSGVYFAMPRKHLQGFLDRLGENAHRVTVREIRAGGPAENVRHIFPGYVSGWADARHLWVACGLCEEMHWLNLEIGAHEWSTAEAVCYQTRTPYEVIVRPEVLQMGWRTGNMKISVRYRRHPASQATPEWDAAVRKLTAGS